ncbi:hypothetical protein V6N13_135077 [Hibiscus sabdariffa]
MVDKVDGSIQSFVEIGEHGESIVVGDKKGECINSLNVSTEHGASPFLRTDKCWLKALINLLFFAKLLRNRKYLLEKPRLVAPGVVDLMNQLKPKAREIKAKKKNRGKEGDLQGVVGNMLNNGFDKLCLSVVYGSNGREKRKVLWRDLVSVKSKFNKEVYGDISARVQAHQIELDKLQKNSLLNPNANNLMRERVVAKDLHDLYRAEEHFFRHKSRIQYIREGDQNSDFFFRQVAIRQKFNMITMLKDSQGHMLESFEAISNELINHFVGSLRAIDENVEVVQDNLL